MPFLTAPNVANPAAPPINQPAFAVLPDWTAVFMFHLSMSGVVSYACREAKISRVTAYEWKENNKEFDTLWKDSIVEAVERLEVKAVQLALDKGNVPMLQFLLRALKPDKYDPARRLLIGGIPGQPMEVDHIEAARSRFFARFAPPPSPDALDEPDSQSTEGVFRELPSGYDAGAAEAGSS